MGKGDPRTRRGKIYQGSFGKSRPKDPAKRKKKAAQAAKRLSGRCASPDEAPSCARRRPSSRARALQSTHDVRQWRERIRQAPPGAG